MRRDAMGRFVRRPIAATAPLWPIHVLAALHYSDEGQHARAVSLATDALVLLALEAEGRPVVLARYVDADGLAVRRADMGLVLDSVRAWGVATNTCVRCGGTGWTERPPYALCGLCTTVDNHDERIRRHPSGAAAGALAPPDDVRS